MFYRLIAAAAIACAPLAAAAQAAAKPDPAKAKAGTPAAAYESAFTGYRPYVDPELARWREVNEEMGRLNGHIGHVPGSVPPRGAAAPTPKPHMHSGHGEKK